MSGEPAGFSPCWCEAKVCVCACVCECTRACVRAGGCVSALSDLGELLHCVFKCLGRL